MEPLKRAACSLTATPPSPAGAGGHETAAAATASTTPRSRSAVATAGKDVDDDGVWLRCSNVGLFTQADDLAQARLGTFYQVLDSTSGLEVRSSLFTYGNQGLQSPDTSSMVAVIVCFAGIVMPRHFNWMQGALATCSGYNLPLRPSPFCSTLYHYSYCYRPRLHGTKYIVDQPAAANSLPRMHAGHGRLPVHRVDC